MSGPVDTLAAGWGDAQLPAMTARFGHPLNDSCEYASQCVVGALMNAASQIAERDAQIAEKVRAIEVFAQITRSCLHWDEAPQKCATPDAIYSSSISENSVVMRIDHLPFIIQKADAEGVERALHSVLAAILAPYFAPAELGLTEANDGE